MGKGVGDQWVEEADWGVVGIRLLRLHGCGMWDWGDSGGGLIFERCGIGAVAEYQMDAGATWYCWNRRARNGVGSETK